MLQSSVKSASRRSLTARQVEVIELIRARLTIKEIAFQLGVTESAVNQRIRALKERLGVNSQRDLIAAYDGLRDSHQLLARDLPTCSETTCSNNQLSEAAAFPHFDSQGNVSPALEFSDVPSFSVRVPWEEKQVHYVAPGMLNGQSAVLNRTGYAVVLAILMMMLVIVGVTAGEVLTRLLSG